MYEINHTLLRIYASNKKSCLNLWFKTIKVEWTDYTDSSLLTDLKLDLQTKYNFESFQGQFNVILDTTSAKPFVKKID